MLYLKNRQNKGFTLVEVVVVIAIIAVLAAIAVPALVTYRQRAYDAAAHQDAKHAYLAAQGYFAEHPGETIAESDLVDYGFQISEGVVLNIIDGQLDSLNMTTNHPMGRKTYTVDSTGSITSSP